MVLKSTPQPVHFEQYPVHFELPELMWIYAGQTDLTSIVIQMKRLQPFIAKY